MTMPTPAKPGASGAASLGEHRGEESGESRYESPHIRFPAAPSLNVGERSLGYLRDVVGSGLFLFLRARSFPTGMSMAAPAAMPRMTHADH